jgi:hypothetical protein
MGRRAPKRSAEAVAHVGAFKRKLLIIYKIKGIFSSFVIKYFITKLEKNSRTLCVTPRLVAAGG